MRGELFSPPVSVRMISLSSAMLYKNVTTSDPLSRCVCGRPLLRKASPAAPLEWEGRGLEDRADVVCEIPQGKCAATEERGQGERPDL